MLTMFCFAFFLIRKEGLIDISSYCFLRTQKGERYKNMKADYKSLLSF